MSLARRSLQVVAFMCTLVVGAASMAVIVTQTTWFKEWLRGFIVRQADDYVNGRLSIGRLDGNLFFGVELGDVDVTVNGETVIDIDDVGLDYNAFTLIGGDVVLDDIRLTRPVIRVKRDAEGWNLVRLIRARTPDPDAPKARRTLEIGEIGISDGTLHIEDAVGTSGIETPARIEKLDASIGVKTNEDELRVDVAHVSLRTNAPEFAVNAMSGVIRRTKNEMAFENVSLRTEESTLRVTGTVKNIEGGAPVLSLKASSDKFAVNELARIVPALRGYELQPAFEMTASGPADRLEVDLSAREANIGVVNADVTVDAMAPGRKVAGTVDVGHLNIAALDRDAVPGRPSPLTSDITGRARIDLTLPSESARLSGTYAVNATRVAVAGYDARNVVADGRIDGQTVRVNGRADAYGGHATATGTVRAGAPLSLDLRGTARNVDLRNLPAQTRAPRVTSNLQFAYTVKAEGSRVAGDVKLDASTLAGASIAEGTVATFAVGDGAPAYTAKGQVTDLDVQRIGKEFGIGALAADRYSSRVNGSFDVSGSGGGRFPLTLDVTGTLVDSSMFGAAFPSMDVTTNVAAGDIRVSTKGSFQNLDPAVVTDNARTAGMLTGTVDADTTIRNYAAGVTVDSIDVAGRVDLAPSTIGKLAIDSAIVDGHYANREGQLTQLAIMGADVNVTGQGAIALNETGASNLTVHAESASLDRIGEIIGQPLKGAAVVDATVTGNARELKADGTLTGSNLGHGENEALSLMSTFSAAMPNLTPAETRVQASSTVTFLEVGGQTINQLTADTTYVPAPANQGQDAARVDFKAVAQQGVRQLAAGGSVVLHPDHQEVHVADLALRAEQIEWRTEPGSEATIRYGGDRIQVRNMQLVNGDQRIHAEGVVGSTTETLQVRAENVDVAQMDTLLLGDGRLAGRFTGNATVSGTTSAPRVSSEFTLSQGAFRDFTFEGLAGTVNYAEQGVDMDVRLQQTPTAWITAKGHAPLTLFRATPPDVEAHGGGGAVDIQVASSQIDLGIIQGFTSYVTNVTGTLQADLRVTGTGYDPHVEGAVDVRGGAFAIPDLGTSYTGLDTRIGLEPDVVNIQEFKILDNRGFPMTVGGTLAVHERSVGAVNVRMQSENFEVIDNELADLKLDTELRITGELRKPRIEGFVEVENGTIHIDRVVERATSNPYSTTAADLDLVGADAAARAAAAEAAAKGEVEPAPEPSLLDAVDLEVALGIPSNLVLRGADIRPANAPIEIGDMVITVGGAVQVQKAPGTSALRILGEVNTIRGNYTFQGRRFEILRDGRIRFDGSEDLDPAVDLRARRLISGVETFVRVQGSMRQPELSFSSNPPLDQADILSLIVFNQPINELGEGQQASLAQQATALAGGYLASGLAQSLGNALELDEFEIQAGDATGFGPSLTVGEQVGEKFFFRVRQGFGDAQATELILEYQITDFLRAQASAAEIAGGTQRLTFRRIERGGLDLFFFFSY
jgi:autotransporter translocation and assembly factor TamB